MGPGPDLSGLALFLFFLDRRLKTRVQVQLFFRLLGAGASFGPVRWIHVTTALGSNHCAFSRATIQVRVLAACFFSGTLVRGALFLRP